MNNLLYILPFIIENEEILKLLTKVELKECCEIKTLMLDFKLKSAKQYRWLYYALRKEPLFYCGIGCNVEFLIPTNKLVLLTSLMSFGLKALNDDEIIKCIKVLGNAKVFEQKSLAARKSSQALFFYININRSIS